jgi:hypothetical protein
MAIQLVQTDQGRHLEVSSPVLEKCNQTIQILDRLSKNAEYLKLCDDKAPPVCKFNPGNTGVCMGYDFHITENNPYLIEINTNVAGLGVLPIEDDLVKKIQEMFVKDYILAFPGQELKTIAIVDESPESQHFYQEFIFYQKILSQAGWTVVICDPKDLSTGEAGALFYKDQKIDLVYLRLTDFYLKTAEVTHIQQAYLQKKVCVSPPPRAFHVLGDKSRFKIFGDKDHLKSFGLSDKEAESLISVIPKTFNIKDKPLEYWQDNRKKYVFKFVDKFGGRGVYLGSTVTHKKMPQLYEQDRIAQELIPPGKVIDPKSQKTLKFDLRIVTYQYQWIAALARVYEGMITNFQSPLSAVLPVKGV